MRGMTRPSVPSWPVKVFGWRGNMLIARKASSPRTLPRLIQQMQARSVWPSWGLCANGWEWTIQADDGLWGPSVSLTPR